MKRLVLCSEVAKLKSTLVESKKVMPFDWINPSPLSLESEHIQLKKKTSMHFADKLSSITSCYDNRDISRETLLNVLVFSIAIRPNSKGHTSHIMKHLSTLLGYYVRYKIQIEI